MEILIAIVLIWFLGWPLMLMLRPPHHDPFAWGCATFLLWYLSPFMILWLAL